MRPRSAAALLAAALAVALVVPGRGARAQDARPEGPRPPDDGAAADAPRASSDAAEPAPGDGFRRTGVATLELHARNLDVAEVFAQLRRLMKKNIVVAPDVKARFTGDLYDVTLAQAIDAVCRSAGLMAREQDGFLYVEPAAVVHRVIRLSYTRAKDVIPIVEPLLGPRGKLTATTPSQRGIKASQDDAGGDDYASSDSIVATDLPGNLDAIEAAIRALDGRPRQILMEATILAANCQDDKTLGVEWKALAGVDFRELGGLSLGGKDLLLGALPPRQLDELTVSGGTNLLQGVPKGGLEFGVLKDDVAVFVRALQQITDVSIMANPKVMVLNKQRGEVIVGRRDGYLTTTTTQTSTEQKVEFLETGTRLLFRPFIGEDGMVRLEIHPEDSNGGVTPNGLPFKETVEVTTNILVPDGQTVVIGGLFRERTLETQSKVPLLGDIPLVGGAFRSTREDRQRQEIMILLTPRIVAPAREPAAAPAGAAAPAKEAAAPAPQASATDAVVVVDADAERRRRADLDARRAENEKLLRRMEELVAEQRRRADETAKSARAAKDDHAAKAAEAEAADRAARAAEAEEAELAMRLAKARETAKAARDDRTQKSQAEAAAAERSRQADAEASDAARAVDETSRLEQSARK